MNAQACLIGELLQACFPKFVPAAVAATAIGCNVQPVRAGVPFCPHCFPPFTDAVYCELGRISANPDIYKAFVEVQIINAVRTGFPSGAFKIVVFYFDGLA